MHNGILLSHKKKQMLPFAVAWVDPEIVILSEVSQKETEEYILLIHLKKMV